MRLKASIVFLLLSALALRAQSAPRLVVLVVVDQMRADYVDRFQVDWNAGLKRLISNGAWFNRAAYPYLDTVTCAGHATIGTGAFPFRHGIFQNIWFDRAANAVVTCTDDTSVKAVSYGKSVAASESAGAAADPDLRRRNAAAAIGACGQPVAEGPKRHHDGRARRRGGHLADRIRSTPGQTSTAFASRARGAGQGVLAANPIEADYGRIWNLLLPADQLPRAR